MEHFFETLNFEKVKIALNTNKQFTFLVRRQSVSIWYKDGGYTSICTKDINTICNKVNKDRFWKK